MREQKDERRTEAEEKNRGEDWAIRQETEQNEETTTQDIVVAFIVEP